MDIGAGAVLRFRALVYDILPPTTAIADYAIEFQRKNDYAIGLEKLSANGKKSMILKRQ